MPPPDCWFSMCAQSSVSLPFADLLFPMFSTLATVQSLLTGCLNQTFKALEGSQDLCINRSLKSIILNQQSKNLFSINQNLATTSFRISNNLHTTPRSRRRCRRRKKDETLNAFETLTKRVRQHSSSAFDLEHLCWTPCVHPATLNSQKILPKENLMRNDISNPFEVLAQQGLKVSSPLKMLVAVKHYDVCPPASACAA